MAKKTVSAKVDSKVSSPAFTGKFTMNESGALKLGEAMVKAKLADKVYRQDAWIWISIPKDIVNTIPYLVPAFRAFFGRFSPKRGEWNHQPVSVTVFAQKAEHFGVKIADGGKEIENLFDDDEVKEQALLKYEGKDNEYPRPKEKKEGKGKKKESSSTDDLIKELMSRKDLTPDQKKALASAMK